MEDPIAGPPAWLDWNDVRWYLNKKDNYYRERNGFLLHLAVWEHDNGQPVPDGHHVHHHDHDRANNARSNLRLLTASEHQRYHALARTDPAFIAQQQSEAVSARITKMWVNRQPRPVVCDQCGVTFYSTGMRAKRCSDDCRRKFGRDNAASNRAARKHGGGV